MLRLFRTQADTDWKGRPSHYLRQLATGSHEELVKKMDEEIAAFQKDELEEDRKMAEEEGEEPPTEWYIQNERWEMNTDSKAWTERPFQYPLTMREICYNTSGDFTNIVYHILDLD